MNTYLEKLILTVSPQDSLTSVVNRMADSKEKLFGIALVVDQNNLLLGVINNGDIIRLMASHINFDNPVSKFMINKPITALVGDTDEQILQTMRFQLLTRSNGKKDITRYVPLIDKDGLVCDVADVFTLLSRSASQGDLVEVYGLGFVGLTLAVALAGRGHIVKGIDVNESLVSQLNNGIPHVFEPRLADMMVKGLDNGHLSFQTKPTLERSRIIIIAVGTPVENDGSTHLLALKAVCEVVSLRLSRGDIIMLRSTVPVGTSRNFVKDILESGSNLKAGDDFSLAFTPERTVEGQAMQELVSLPQIVGGLTVNCVEKASSFWRTLSDSVVHVDSMEAAELVKLINNSYRDLSFSFSNGLALLADRYNLDASRIISAANDGYPRNKIPRPSPGVGGYCLTKDPYLYASADKQEGFGALSKYGRKLNEKAGRYPLKVIHRFCERESRQISDLSILIVGLAFKGQPDTNDLRASSAIEIAKELTELGCDVNGFDAVISSKAIELSGIKSVDLLAGAKLCDALIIMNNNPRNIIDGLVASLSGRKSLLFDGWSMLDKYEVEQYKDITYSTMGYMTPKDEDFNG